MREMEVQSDRWLNSYAQMISQDFVTNGVQHTQKKQMEIVQAQDRNKNVQVVRAEIQIRGFSSNFDNAKISKPNSLDYLAQKSNASSTSYVNDFWNNSKYGKSTSDENLSLMTLNNNDSSESPDWNRVSRIRRSLQLQRPPLSESFAKPSITRRSINVLSVKQAFEERGSYLDKETKHKINDFVALNSILSDSSKNGDRKDDFSFTRKTFEPPESTRDRFRRMYERSLNNFEDYKKDGIKNILEREPVKDVDTKKEENLEKDINQICTVENNDNSSMTIIKIINHLNSGKTVQDPKVTSIILNQDGIDDPLKNKKKVEFCKTEVHFTAGEGKVKIVETDEKPPPTSRLRRRRKKLSDEGLDEAFDNPDSSKNPFEIDSKLSDDTELRGILKNRKIKPKPYHLGDNLNILNSWELKTEPERVESYESQPVIEFESKEKSADMNLMTSGLHKENINKLDILNGLHKTTNLQDKDVDENAFKNDFNALKSTNLILKTMNLAEEFDETMKAFENLKLDKANSDEKLAVNEVKVPALEFKPSVIIKADLGQATSKIKSKPTPVAPSRQKNIYSNTLELHQLKKLYENQEVCEEKINLNKIDLKREIRLDPVSEISGSWHRVKVKKKNNPEPILNVPKKLDEKITADSPKPKITQRLGKKEPSSDIFSTSTKTHSHKDSLTGTRKLREHELSFFGIQSENRMRKFEKVEKIERTEKLEKHRINVEVPKEVGSFRTESKVEPLQKKVMKSIGIQVCVPDKPRIHKTVHATISKSSSNTNRKTVSTDSKSRSSSGSKERPKTSKKKV